MKIAAIDVGTNSFHLLVAVVGVEGSIEVVDRAKDMVRLGETAFKGGVITPEGFARGVEALRGFRRLLDRHQCDAVVAVATSAVREAQNGGEFVRAMHDSTGIELRVIRGDEEAHLVYLGARSSLDFGGRRALIVDVGGGSVELIVGDARESYAASSLKLGVLRLLEKVTGDPIGADERTRLAAHCHRSVEACAPPLRRVGFDFVAMTSGTAHAIGDLIAIQRGAEVGPPRAGTRGRRVAFKDVLALEDLLATRPPAERARMGLDPKRIDSIVPGVILVRSILEVFHADEMVLCETALREGLIADYIAKNRPGLQLVEEFPDLRRRSVFGLCRRCGVHQGHAEQVARLSLDLFRGTRLLHGLPNADGELLEFAALLHDIGYHIAPARHHKHGEYLIANYDMKGFTSDEVTVLAQVVRYHRKTTPKESHEAFARLSPQLKRKVRTLAAILRVADGLDRSYGQLVRQVHCDVGEKSVTLRVAAVGDPALEVWGARRKRDLFEEVFARKMKFDVRAEEEEGEAPPAGG
ncbi:MAG: Ppx/GppA family phosphatase [Myxococcales bacterium]|nr:Ppx/GppA family phosphatase [Myxococcales bacterium]